MQERHFADLAPGAVVTAFEFDWVPEEQVQEEEAELSLSLQMDAEVHHMKEKSQRSPRGFLRDVEFSLDALRSRRPEPIVL